MLTNKETDNSLPVYPSVKLGVGKGSFDCRQCKLPLGFPKFSTSVLAVDDDEAY